LKSATLPSLFLILPTVLTMSRLLLLFPCSQAWDFRKRRAKINLSRNHGENEEPFDPIPYIV